MDFDKSYIKVKPSIGEKIDAMRKTRPYPLQYTCKDLGQKWPHFWDLVPFWCRNIHLKTPDFEVEDHLVI